jgi:putative ABC transport system permease protein
VGILLAAWGVDTLKALAPEDVPRLDAVGVNGAVVACAVAATALTALACGLLPALRLSNAPALEALKAAGGHSSAGRKTQRLRSGLVVLQVSLALVLVCGAGLLVRSFVSLRGLDPGYDASDLLTARIELNQATYTDSPKRAAVYEQILDRVRALPGVQSAALVLMRPLSGAIGWDYPFLVEGQSPSEQAGNPYSNYLAISPDYFRTLKLPLLAGRDFSSADRKDAPRVVIVGESMARRFWPEGQALGKRLKFGKAESEKPWLTVVGVVKDARYREWSAVRPDLYVPYLQQAEFRTDLMVRTSLPPLSLAPEIREIVAAVDPGQPLSEVTTMEAAVDAALARPRFNAWLASVLAVLALSLAVVGVYGVIGYAVSTRQWEIGVRLALGARREQVLWMILRQGAVLAALGVALGLPVYLGVARLMQGLLYGVTATDPLTVISVSAALVLAAAVGAAAPALRASRLSPSLALREEG